MKFEPKDEREVLFNTVTTGEVVKFNNRIFLVIEDINDIDKSHCNVVDVSSGEVAFICAQDEVELLDVVLKEV